ncbi:MAG: Ig-like domain-containing protein, partial [Candidatus Micrarchaeota archaeon]
NGCEIPAIGEPAFQQIIYRAWDVYASSTESFNAFVVHMNQSCQDLYGSTHPEYCVSLVKAYQAVEMDQGGTCSNGTEAAPACAVKNAGSVYTKNASGARIANFTSSETIWVGGENGVAGKTVNVHLIKHNGTLANWAKINPLLTVSATVLANGTISVPLGIVNEAGVYDLIVDGDRDGFYQPWADSTAILQVYTPIVNAPPNVTLVSSNQTAIAGQPFTITVSGSSPYPLASVWWGVSEPSNPSFHNISGSVDGVAVNLAAAQGYGSCLGQTYCQFTRTVVINNPGTYQIWANARDTLYPVPGEPHQASEGIGLAVVSMNINPAFLAMPAVKTVVVGKTLGFSISAQDQNGDALRLEMVKGVSGAVFVPGATVVNSDGTSSIVGNFQWTPNFKQTGTYAVQFKVTDGQGGVALSAPVQINVVKNLVVPIDIE